MSSDIRNVSYSLWDEIATNHPSWTNYHYAQGDDYEITTGDGEHVFVSYVGDSDLTAWTADFLPTSTAVTEKDDAVVRVMGTRHLVSAPREEDGKPTFVMSPAQTGWGTWFTSHGDDPSPTPPASGRGDGQAIEIDFTVPETKSIEFSFKEPVQIHDGELSWDPTEWGSDDEISFSLVLPATTITANAGAGNCNLVDVGGFNLIVPAADDGSHDVTMTQAVPVSSRSNTGYWDVDRGTGVVTASTAPGASAFNLFDIQFESFLIKRLMLCNPLGIFAIDAYKAEWISERHKGKLKVTRVTTGSGKISGWLMLFRESTT